MTATIACFVAVMVPVTVSAFASPFAAGWWPVVLLFTVPWLLVAAILGYGAGRLAATASNVWLAAMIGVAVSFVAAGAFTVLFVSSAEAQQIHTPEHLAMFASSIGAVTGGAAWRSARRCRAQNDGDRFRYSISEILLHMGAIAAYFASGVPTGY